MIAIPNFSPKDGLYQIDKGRIHKYKAKGGTVRVYDIIDIVRCEECKWAEKEGDESEGYLTCACHIPRFFVPQDGFCFLGERREE